MSSRGHAISPAYVSGRAADNSLAKNRLMNAKEIAAPSARYPLLLLGIFILFWSLLAIKPWYRQDWLLENALVFIVVPTLIWSYHRIRFSNFGYSLIFIFLCLHEIGAHYTYAEVPYREWLLQITGLDINISLGINRNHFDRFVHFCYGLLLLPVCIEIFNARANLTKIWQYVVPVAFIMSHSELFELIEWQAAEIFGGPLGQAYLGTQGDIWDAQKDSLAAALGAVISMGIYQTYQAFRTNTKQIGDLLLMD